jgi:hypothetical protein
VVNYLPEVVIKAILYDFINRLFGILTTRVQFSIRRFESRSSALPVYQSAGSTMMLAFLRSAHSFLVSSVLI